MRKFLATSAAIAMAATIANADPGGDKGSKDRGSAAQMKGNGAGKANPVAKQDRGPAMRGNGNRADRGPDKAVRPGKAERNAERRIEHRVEREVRDIRRDDRVRDSRRDARIDRVVGFDFRENRGLIAGCPPGLAKKRNGCTPPGQLNKRRDNDRFRNAYSRSDWWGYESLGDRVFYDNGYLFQLGDNNSILGYIPLLGGALSVGNVWPSMYQPVQVPNYYTDFYNLGTQDSYRYADNVLYRVDPQSSAITSIAALLTGDNFTVGQPMPAGYDVYNVPQSYRDRYYDRPDANYRYSDGKVYQVDPKTRLVAAAIELLI